MSLPRVRSGLLKHPLDGQMLVYDKKGDRVHLLDPTSACVLDLLTTGDGWTREGLVHEMGERLGIKADSALLTLALDQLAHSDLLEQETQPAVLTDVTRRDLVKKLAMTGAAALLIPAVATLTASPSYAQSQFGAGGPCSTNANCNTGTCCVTTGRCQSTPCLPNGNVGCTSGYQCCSCNCSAGGNCTT